VHRDHSAVYDGAATHAGALADRAATARRLHVSDRTLHRRFMGRIRSGTTTITACATVALSLALVVPAGAQAPAKKPNIVVIFGDDIGQRTSVRTRS